jgi:flagellar basal body-associated protein FliL
MPKNSEKRIKLLVIILSILLALSIAALAAVLIYDGVKHKNGTNVRIPDNYITPEQSGNMPENEASQAENKKRLHRLTVQPFEKFGLNGIFCV